MEINLEKYQEIGKEIMDRLAVKLDKEDFVWLMNKFKELKEETTTKS